MSMALQQQLYAAAFRRAQALMGQASRELAQYEESFFASLPPTFAPSSPAALQGAMARHRVVLCGDFHTLPSSQSTFINLLAAVLRQRTWAAPPLIALECFQASAQTAVDAYLAGHCDEEELLVASCYHRNWGFPWEHYRPILNFARQHGLAVVALNQQYSGSGSLAKRDEFMAKRLLAALALHPQSQVFCLIGEQHLAPAHLPARLAALAGASPKPQLPPLRIVSNCDHYFFSVLAQAKAGGFTPCLQLADELYCLLGEPPWYKWLTHSLWSDCLVHEIGRQGAGASLNYTALSAEIDDYFVDLLRLLCGYLGLTIDEDSLVDFHFKILPPAGPLPVALLAAGTRALPAFRNKRQLARPEGAAHTYAFDPLSNTITWSAFAWDGFVSAAGEFLFSRGRHTAELPGSTSYAALSQQVASQLALLLLNPARAFTPPASALHKKWALAIARAAATFPWTLAGDLPLHPPAARRLPLPSADLCQLIAAELYRAWQADDTYLQSQLSLIFAPASTVMPAFLASLLAHLRQSPGRHPRLASVSGRGSKSG